MLSDVHILLISNILHQMSNFEIFDGKIVMSKFARIFETYSAIIIFRENAFPKTCDWIFLELFRCTARYDNKQEIMTGVVGVS